MAGISGIQRKADSPLSTGVPFALASILEGYGVDVVSVSSFSARQLPSLNAVPGPP